MMNAGRINTRSKAGRLYRHLYYRRGREVSAVDLQESIGARTAISTYVSMVRQQLPEGWDVACRKERWHTDTDCGWLVFYRLAVPPGTTDAEMRRVGGLDSGVAA